MTLFPQVLSANIPAYVAAMTDPYLEPELAIGCFERWSGLTVTVHDLEGRLEPYLAASRHWHVAPTCAAIKRSAHGAKCIAFEVQRVREDAPLFPHGRMQVCHAGLVEAVMPVRRGDVLELILFAGQRLAGSGLRAAVDAQEPTPLPNGAPRPAPLGPEEAGLVLEGLRQLAARLRLWLDELVSPAVAQRLPAPSDRRGQVLQFIADHHHEPVALADLAALLGLSRHRTAHVVKELFNQTFITLLTEARLRSACAMLTHTALTIPDLARRSGFGDPDHFHRVFRRALRTTPGRYRAGRMRREA
jgi:AraC-like DNA-binding protein